MGSLVHALRACDIASRDAVTRASLGALSIWCVLLLAAVPAGFARLAGISALAGLSMLAGAAWAAVVRVDRPRLAWIDGLAAGVMIASAVLFLLPVALRAHAVVGALGIAAGLIIAFALTAKARFAASRPARFDPRVTALTLHGAAAGLVLGIAYARMPAIGALLSVAIVCHKLPAGYAAARHLQRRGESLLAVVWPACAVGLSALPTAMLATRGAPLPEAALFGFATGLFAYVAIDFLPVMRQRPSRPIMWHAPLAVAAGVLLVAALHGFMA